MVAYIHSYTASEASRLVEQASIFEELIHGGTAYPAGARVLEAGCGVGAQTMVLARRHPGVVLTCVDISEPSLAAARARIADAAIPNVSFHRADLAELPFDAASFDHVFMSMVLEHVGDRPAALRGLARVLRPGGTLTIFEVDHATSLFCPTTEASLGLWHGMVRAQAAMGGDAEIGHKLFPLLRAAGFRIDRVEPRPLYVDASWPDRVASVIGQVVTPALEDMRNSIVAYAGMDPGDVDRGITEWRTLSTDPDFVFTHTFFRAVATRPGNRDQGRNE